MSEIQRVVVTLTVPTEKKRFPFIPTMGATEEIQMSQCFHSKEEMLQKVGSLLESLAGAWDEQQ